MSIVPHRYRGAVLWQPMKCWHCHTMYIVKMRVAGVHAAAVTGDSEYDCQWCYECWKNIYAKPHRWGIFDPAGTWCDSWSHRRRTGDATLPHWLLDLLPKCGISSTSFTLLLKSCAFDIGFMSTGERLEIVVNKLANTGGFRITVGYNGPAYLRACFGEAKYHVVCVFWVIGKSI